MLFAVKVCDSAKLNPEKSGMKFESKAYGAGCPIETSISPEGLAVRALASKLSSWKIDGSPVAERSACIASSNAPGSLIQLRTFCSAIGWRSNETKFCGCVSKIVDVEEIRR